MKRRRPFVILSRDRNKDAALLAGRKAREANRPITDCPRLQRFVSDSYALIIEKAWVDGWHQRDAEMRSPTLPLEGAS